VRWRKANKRPATFLPLEFEPGQDAQVDWGEVQVILAGVPQKVQVFVMHLSYSCRTFVMTFPAQKREAFFYLRRQNAKVLKGAELMKALSTGKCQSLLNMRKLEVLTCLRCLNNTPQGQAEQSSHRPG
jgi:hypothetical protein